MTDTKPNAELAYRVLDQIDAHPTHFDMSSWVRFGERPSDRPDGIVTLDDLTNPACGTTACFAGWAVALSGYAMDDSGIAVHPDPPTDEMHAEELAAQLLGLTGEEADDLFNVADDYIHAEVRDIFGARPEARA